MTNIVKVSKIKPLKEDIAIELASDLFSEGLVFVVAVGVLLFEHSRKVRKDEEKEITRNRRLGNLELTLLILATDIEEQNRLLNKMGYHPGTFGTSTKDSPVRITGTNIKSEQDSSSSSEKQSSTNS